VRDSWGISGTGETPTAQSAEEAHRTPPGKRASWSGDQQHLTAGEIAKKPYILNKKQGQ
jgi:hypothetical protein